MISQSIRICMLSALGALGLGISPAQTSAVPVNPEESQPKLTTDEKFSNLPAEKRTEFVQHLQEASKLFGQKRIFESLDEIAKAKEIFPDSPDLSNLEGSCYVEFRDFDKARKFFEKALELSPDSTSVLFNIAEVDFCSRNWDKAAKEFTELLPKLTGKQASMKELAEFKILLCKLKTGQVEEARKMVDNHGFMDDTPYYFFAQAAIFFHDGDNVKAEEWLGRGMRIFRNPRILAPWQDTLIEFGYLKSFYGGDLQENQ